MNFSLISVSERRGNKVDGSWIQGVCGADLDEAIARARSIEEANDNRIFGAVVAELTSVVPMGHWTDLLEIT